MSLHPAAAQGFANAAETYVRGRPGYPPEVAGWLTGALGLGPGRRVAEVGAGTGKFTPHLLATGAEVTAVEPVAEMLATLRARLPEVAALSGAAEAIPAEDESFDAVVCAQAFHWFATAEAVAEFRRVLKPGGRLGLIWNVRDERAPWVAELRKLVEPWEGDAPRFHTGEWRKPFPAPGFGPLELASFPSGHVGSAEQVIVDRTMSISFIGALPAEEKAKVEAGVRALIARTPELSGGEVVHPYVTEAYCCRKL